MFLKFKVLLLDVDYCIIFSGLRSYGKVVYVFSVVPVLGVLVLCSKLLGLTPLYRGFFPQTEWSEFFLNPKSWISAATEVMLTWNLLGAAVMQVTSHNRSNKRLWRDIATITLLTLVVLILVAFLGNMCHQLILLKGYSYVPSSFGNNYKKLLIVTIVSICLLNFNFFGLQREFQRTLFFDHLELHFHRRMQSPHAICLMLLLWLEIEWANPEPFMKVAIKSLD